MMKLSIIFFMISILNSCYFGSVAQTNAMNKLAVEQWKSILITKITAENAVLNDSLWWVKSSFYNLQQQVQSTNINNFLLKFDTAKHQLGHIPPKASTYVVIYFSQGETSVLNYGMFWIKRNRSRGVWQDKNWKWNAMDTKTKYLKQLIEFRTDLDSDELLTTSGEYILITEFKGRDLIDANFVAVLSLSQFLVANTVFRSQKP